MSGRDRSAKRWREIVSRSARGETLSNEEAHYRAAYEVAHPDDAAAEAGLWESLGRLGDEPAPSERDDDDLVAGALSMLDAPQQSESLPEDVRHDEPNRRPVAIVVLAVSGLAAAAVVALSLLRPGVFDLQASKTSQPQAPSISEPSDQTHEALERRERPRHSAHRSAPEKPEPEPEPEQVPEASPDPVTSKAASTARRSGSSRPLPDADNLLETAQNELASGQTQGAMRAYRTLLAKYPGSNEANTALVSLGRIELKRGRARKALHYFDRYLGQSAGALREEARYGRIRALRSLGRDEQELASIEAFLADHPKSLYAPRLKRRAEELRAAAP